MLLAKKTPLMMQVPAPNYRKQLNHLYARRSAIDTLIHSLEEYERSQPKATAASKRKTA